MSATETPENNPGYDPEFAAKYAEVGEDRMDAVADFGVKLIIDTLSKVGLRDALILAGKGVTEGLTVKEVRLALDLIQHESFNELLRETLT